MTAAQTGPDPGFYDQVKVLQRRSCTRVAPRPQPLHTQQT